jgi:hypothetical protein
MVLLSHLRRRSAGKSGTARARSTQCHFHVVEVARPDQRDGDVRHSRSSNKSCLYGHARWQFLGQRSPFLCASQRVNLDVGRVDRDLPPNSWVYPVSLGHRGPPVRPRGRSGSIFAHFAWLNEVSRRVIKALRSKQKALHQSSRPSVIFSTDPEVVEAIYSV